MEAGPWTAPRTQVVAGVTAGVALGIAVALLSPPLAVLAVAGLAAAFAILRWPELGLLGFIAVANLLPFAVVPVRFGLSLTFVDVLVTGTLVAWLYWVIFRSRAPAGSRLALPVLVFLGLAIASFVLGLAYSISPERARLFFKSLNSTFLFFSVLNCLGSLTAVSRAMSLLLACGSAAAGLALFLFFIPSATAIQLLSALGPLGYPTGPGVLRPIADTDTLRAIGTSIDPNVLGGLMMLTSAALVGQLFSAKPLFPRWALWPMLGLAAAALLLTMSRSAWVGFAAAVVMLATIQYRRLWILMAVFMIALPLLPQAEVFVARLQSGLAFEDRASAMRLGEYQDAIELILAYPWFGIGFGEPPSIDLYLGVSSMYLLVGQEMGLLGLGAFLTVLGLAALEIARGLRTVSEPETRGILLGLAAALCSAVVAGLADHYFTNIIFPHMVALLWLYLGLAVAVVRLSEEPSAQPRLPRT